MQGFINWPLAWFRNSLAVVLTRERRERRELKARIELLEANYATAKKMFNSILQTNRIQGETITKIEAENIDLRNLVVEWEKSSAHIDPNAQCPVCGARDGELETVVKMNSSKTAAVGVQCTNICQECGYRFISSGPIADRYMGEGYAKSVYQPDLGGRRIPDEKK